MRTPVLVCLVAMLCSAAAQSGAAAVKDGCTVYPNGFVNCIKANPVTAADGPDTTAFDMHMAMGSGNSSAPAASMSYNGTMGSMNATWNGTSNGTAATFRLGAVIPYTAAAAGPADVSSGDLTNTYTATGPSVSSEGLDPMASAVSNLLKLLSPLSGEVYLRVVNNSASGGGYVVKQDGTSALAPVVGADGIFRNAIKGKTAAALGLLKAGHTLFSTAAQTMLADTVSLVTGQTSVVKSAINKNLQNAIDIIDAVHTSGQQLLSTKGGVLKSAATGLQSSAASLPGVVPQLKAAGADNFLTVASDLTKMAGTLGSGVTSIIGDVSSTVDQVFQLGQAKISAVKDAYLTTEGAMKSAVAGTVQHHVGLLDGALAHTISSLESLKNNTGPYASRPLSFQQTKLSLLKSHLDKISSAVSAAPVPSQLLSSAQDSTASALSNLASSSLIGKKIASAWGSNELDQSLLQLVAKINSFNGLYKHFFDNTAAASATSG